MENVKQPSRFRLIINFIGAIFLYLSLGIILGLMAGFANDTGKYDNMISLVFVSVAIVYLYGFYRVCRSYIGKIRQPIEISHK